MRRASLLALSCLVLPAVPALAADVDFAGAGLPTFARAPEAAQPKSNDFWKGLSYGVEAFGVSGKGIKGGFGGAANVAWTKPIDDRLSFQLKTSAGYMPGVWKASPWGRAGATGSNFVFAEASVGYEIGRVRPWASVGAGYAKATRYGGFAGGLNSVNDMFGEPGKGSGLVAVGAGVDYAITNNLTVGVAVHAVQAK
jgi:opacity protein-like surface antigen